MRSVEQHFNLEDGTMKLGHHFFAVARYDLPGAFVFPSLQPVLDYLNSTRALREPQLPRRVSWDDFMNVMSDQIQRLINHFGELVVNKLAGVLVATDRRRFAPQYVADLTHEETTNTPQARPALNQAAHDCTQLSLPRTTPGSPTHTAGLRTL